MATDNGTLGLGSEILNGTDYKDTYTFCMKHLYLRRES